MPAEPDQATSDKPRSAADSSISSPSAAGAWATISKHKVVQWTLAYVAAGFALVHPLACRAIAPLRTCAPDR